MSEKRFVQAAGYCMLLPGPEAQQLATYVGWSLHGTRGGLAAGGLFILPGFLSILALSIAYVQYGHVPAIEGVLFGLKAAVLGIVLHAVWRLRERVLAGTGGVAIAITAFVVMFALDVAFPFVIAGAALVGVALRLDTGRRSARAGDDASRLSQAHSARAGESSWSVAALNGWYVLRTALIWLAIWLVPVALLGTFLGGEHVLFREATFFSRTAVITFGGAYAVLSYVAQQAVEVYGWLSPAEMLDGLGLTETTPGPLIQVVQFVGFLGAYRAPGAMNPLLAGVIGSIVTAWVTFAPCFLFIFAGAPMVEQLQRWKRIQWALNGIFAAVVGVILNLAVWFGVHTLFGRVRTYSSGILDLQVPVWSTVNWAALVLTALATVALFRLRAGLFTVILSGAALGWLVQTLG